MVRLLPFTAGDELADQRAVFRRWLRRVFLSSLSVMQLQPPDTFLEQISSVKQYSWKIAGKGRRKEATAALSEFHGVTVSDFTLTKRKQLHREKREPPTLRVDFDFHSKDPEPYSPGDHLSVFPCNPAHKVEYLR